MMLETLERVKQGWLSERIILASAPTSEELQKSFSQLEVGLTDEIQSVFSVLTGFVEDDLDSECFTFWTLARIVRENLRIRASRIRATGKTYIHFADFLIDSHTYCFRVGDDKSTSVYCHWDNDYIVKICDSFETFFEYYLTEAKKLFPA